MAIMKTALYTTLYHHTHGKAGKLSWPMIIYLFIFIWELTQEKLGIHEASIELCLQRMIGKSM